MKVKVQQIGDVAMWRIEKILLSADMQRCGNHKMWGNKDMDMWSCGKEVLWYSGDEMK